MHLWIRFAPEDTKGFQYCVEVEFCNNCQVHVWLDHLLCCLPCHLGFETTNTVHWCWVHCYIFLSKECHPHHGNCSRNKTLTSQETFQFMLPSFQEHQYKQWQFHLDYNAHHSTLFHWKDRCVSNEGRRDRNLICFIMMAREKSYIQDTNSGEVELPKQKRNANGCKEK